MKFKAILLSLSMFLCVAISLFAQAFAANECTIEIQNQTQRVTLLANNIAIKPGKIKQVKYICASIPAFTITSPALIASGGNPVPMRLKSKNFARKSINLIYPDDFKKVKGHICACKNPPGNLSPYGGECVSPCSLKFKK